MLKKILSAIFCLLSFNAYSQIKNGEIIHDSGLFYECLETQLPAISQPWIMKNYIIDRGISHSEQISDSSHQTRYIRFLKLGPVLIDEVHFSLGISNIPPLDFNKEPEIDTNNGQDNLITDKRSYEKVIKYILSNKRCLQDDTSGLHALNKVGSYKIIIEQKKVFYLSSRNSKFFFSCLYEFLKEEKVDDRIVTEMLTDDYR